jgi:hypothetical protein
VVRVRHARYRGTVERHAEALAILEKPGDMALVVRGVPRMLVFVCPDGCGDIVPVNLDGRADKAWRYYCRNGRSSLYPSVWRDEGCKAHFVLWNDVIRWSGLPGGETQPGVALGAVFSNLRRDEFRSYFQIALDMDEIPWAVSEACSELVRDKLAEEGLGNLEGHYRLRH